ncbi:MAG: hypothetical protein ACU843_15090 [Gammaproteobacteria bacterium]
MKNLSFLQGVGFALGASLAGGAMFFGLTPWFESARVFKLIVSSIAFANLAWLLMRAPRRSGRLTALAIGLVFAALAWFFIPSILLFVAWHLGMIWLIRALYFYRSLGAALIDLAVCAMSLAFGAWAFRHSGNPALGIWCLFLGQALAALIPEDFKQACHPDAGPTEANERFDRAYRSAEWALRNLP